MRVTQNMLTSNTLKYISKNYERLAQIQDQINTGKKITRPSQDPVVAMKGMRYRSQLVEVEQFYRNLTEGFTWLENSDAALEETTQVLNRIRDLVVQASNDTYDPVARDSIAKEIEQLRLHLVSMANTKVGDNYIFNGTKTDSEPVNSNRINIEFNELESTSQPENYVVSYNGETYKYQTTNGTTLEFESKFGNKILIDTNSGEVIYQYQEELKYKDGQPVVIEKTINSSDLVISAIDAVSANTEDVVVEVMKGVTIPINIRPQDAYSIELFSSIESIIKMLKNENAEGKDINKAIQSIDQLLSGVNSTRAEVGARQNRADLVENRLLMQQVIAEKTVSDNEDIDFEKAIIDLTTQESLHRAALAAGARIIQPTLLDFLR
ncbi:flagellar hook-associated protein FlgL [Calidifontibacillus erzurumensis]|uniref:Flagellar hook-associated protein FlgL n=1 Tax=Calidifontibacillus erzurumensis TaxID=2741433 RepID=A0A8J8GDR1_9BACI|nr:flagellar hook-associated protein FlgL [Calidifontibacillus erzurumensis]NSL51782.1 flagellar hook-associated protein FlgL [Calidifontibacillus erzurumensis]